MQNKAIPTIEALSKGTYGCILQNGPSCQGKQESPEYVTKIQLTNKVSKNEQNISNKIMGIVSYSNYFAPIIESCEVSLSTIDKDVLSKCEITNVNNKNGKYESNKIKYVGKKTLADYLSYILTSSKGSGIFLNTFVNNNIRLLEGIEMLNSAGIIHHDIKNNNIMCREDGRPIIIDYGLAIDTTLFGNAEYNYKDAFGIYDPVYGPWCIDMFIITYILNKKNKEKQEEVVTMFEMEKVLNEYINKNSAINVILDSREKLLYTANLKSYFNQFEKNYSTWKIVLDELLKCKGTWDNYALAVVYLQLFSLLELEQYAIEHDKMGEYNKVFKQIVMAMPGERPTPTDTKTIISNIFGKVSRQDTKKIIRKMSKSKTPESAANLQKQLALATLTDMEQSKLVYAGASRSH